MGTCMCGFPYLLKYTNYLNTSMYSLLLTETYVFLFKKSQ